MSTKMNPTHAPSNLRDKFLEWLDSDDLKDLQPVESVLETLAKCGDVLPAEYCDQLALPTGSTYGEAVRRVRAGRMGDSQEPDTSRIVSLTRYVRTVRWARIRVRVPSDWSDAEIEEWGECVDWDEEESKWDEDLNVAEEEEYEVAGPDEYYSVGAREEYDYDATSELEDEED